MRSKTLELEGKTIDSAIRKACREFGVSREKLNIEIISEGSSGFLGLMARKAKIRASLLSLDMDFSLSSGISVLKFEAEQESAQSQQPEPARNTDQEISHDVHRQEKTKPEKEIKAPSVNATENRQAAQPKPERRSTKPSSSAPRRRSAHSDAHAHTKPAPDHSPAFSPQSPATTPVEAIAATTPSALKAKELLSGILSRMTFECRVTATETPDTIILCVDGDDNALLIGRRGQNLDALQYLLNKAVNKSDTERKKVVVDSEEYRKRREASLLDMAEKIRKKVKETQKPLSLSNMNAHDRRIIHLALQEDDSLMTRSRGEGEYRKVIVMPAKKGNGSGKSKNKPFTGRTKPQP